MQLRYPVILFILLAILTLTLLSISCQLDPDPTRTRISRIAQPYVFNLEQWETHAIINKLAPTVYNDDETLDTAAVSDYFKRAQTARRETGFINSDRSRLVERTLQVLIIRELRTQGISCPVDGLNQSPVVFPPVLFNLEELPSILVISPRHQIELVQRVTLRSGLTPPERMSIEGKCDALEVSSLVDDIAGISTFPAMFTPDYGIRNTLATASEEWLHQYLAFTPLGFRYLKVIGESSDIDMVASLNETLVGMVSEEIANGIMLDHFPEITAVSYQGRKAAAFNFRNEMRATRLRVDEMLAAGEIRQAEDYMEDRRRLFIDNGYYLRKLNQAYFAFHGTYAYSPASTSPVFEALKSWRARFGSLRDFLLSTSRMTGFAQLQKALT